MTDVHCDSSLQEYHIACKDLSILFQVGTFCRHKILYPLHLCCEQPSSKLQSEKGEKLVCISEAKWLYGSHQGFSYAYVARMSAYLLLFALSIREKPDLKLFFTI